MVDQDWSEVREAVAERLLARSAELTGELAARLTDVLRDSGALDPTMLRLVDLLARSIVVESMGAMRDLVPGPQAHTVTAALVLARRLAEAGVTATRTDRVFHVAQAWWQDTVLNELEQTQPHGVGMDLMGPLMNWQLKGFLGMADAAGQEHAAVLDCWRTAADSALETRVAFVLAEVEDAAEAEEVLHYSMAERHVGLVIWSNRGLVQAPKLRQLVVGLGVEHGVMDTLVVPRDISSIFVWLSLSGTVRQAIAAICRRVGDELTDVRVSAGEPLSGLQGFKTSHEQALAARRMAQLPGSRKWRCIQYRDVAASTLLVNHPEDAEPWATTVLGDLAGPGEDAERLRETLRVYLESGENASRAAGRLYVHRNTVKYRVARALELLAVPLESHRLSVALALNYHHVAVGNDGGS